MNKKPKNLRQVNALMIIIFLCSIFWLMPLVLIFINSFKPYNDMIQDFLALPKSWSLAMYIETWTKFKFPMLIGNTLLYTFCTVIMIVLMAPMAAYKLARTKSRLSKVCFVLIIMPMMVPFQSYMITLTRLVANVNLTGKRMGNILVNIGLCMPLADLHDPWFCKECSDRTGGVCLYRWSWKNKNLFQHCPSAFDTDPDDRCRTGYTGNLE